MKTNLNLCLLKAYSLSARFTQDRIFFTLTFFSLLFVLVSAVASAQTQTITGIIQDDEQQALAGVSVFVKGTNQGVLSDEHGRFSISVNTSKYDVLVFSFLAKKTTEVSIAERGATIDLTLHNDPTYFIELVVIGEVGSDQLYTEKKSQQRTRKKSKRVF